MTVTQKQCLLVYWELILPEEIDGIWGPKSAAATKKLQALLGLVEDGVWGNDTDKAVREAISGGFSPTANCTGNANQTPTADVYADAEKYLHADGYYHIPRGVNVQLSKNLWSREVECQGKGCCTESIIYKPMVDTYQEIRDDYGEAIEITTKGGSGFRCQIHNAKVNGSGSSLHLTGSAFDLHCRDKERLLPIVVKHITDGEIGTYNWGIHAGVWHRGFVNRFNG